MVEDDHVLSSSICQVVLQLLSPILFCQCGHLSFCSLRVFLPRQKRPHVDPPSAPLSRVPLAHLLHLFQLSLFSSLSLALSRRPYLCMRSSLPFLPRFSQQSSDSISTIVVVVLSLFHAMPALHNPDNLQRDREAPCQQTTRKIFLAQPLNILSTTLLGKGGPAPSLSDVTFFVNFNSGTICLGVPHKPLQFVGSQASLSAWQHTKRLLFDHDDQQ